MKSVLITNGQLRKALSATRSLGGKGISVTVSEETKFNIAGFSKYCKNSVKSPNAKKQPDKYLEWLLDLLNKNPCDVLFPMDDDTMNIVINHYEELKKFVALPIPSIEAYRITSDKGKTTKLAIESGLDCPKTVLPEDSDDLLELTSNMNYPLIIKPRISSGSRGLSIVNKSEDLVAIYKKIHKNYPNPIIQECIGLGDRYDVCLLFNSDSKLKASFVQKEIRHFPLKMGPSTVQESVWIPELIEKCMPLMKKLKWYGIVELEFMVDSRTGKIMFMEINPRFWNSLHMAVIAGVDFPILLYKLANNEEFKEVFNYKTGIQCRWLLPGDILHFLFNRDRLKLKPPFWWGSGHHVYDDIISKEDPLPALGFILACIRYLFDIKMWRFIFKR